MRPAGVVELDPIADGPRGVLDVLEAVAMNAFVGKTVRWTVF
jgi:hypothetical protein